VFFDKLVFAVSIFLVVFKFPLRSIFVLPGLERSRELIFLEVGESSPVGAPLFVPVVELLFVPLRVPGGCCLNCPVFDAAVVVALEENKTEDFVWLNRLRLVSLDQ